MTISPKMDDSELKFEQWWANNGWDTHAAHSRAVARTAWYAALRQDRSGGEAWHCPLHHPEWCSCPQPREPSHEEIIRQSKILVDAAEGEFWRDAVVQWPQRFLHARDCNVHSPTLRPCSCLLETRLKGEILRLHRAAPQEREGK